jgi:hypothetical protein
VFTHDDTESTSDFLQRLTIQYTKLEPEFPVKDLLQLDLLADEFAISMLQAMGILIPAETYAYGEYPKKLTTRMVKIWRDKFINGVHVWTQRSRGSFGYVLCAIDIVDAFLMVPQKDLTQVTPQVTRWISCLENSYLARGMARRCGTRPGVVFLAVNLKSMVFHRTPVCLGQPMVNV